MLVYYKFALLPATSFASPFAVFEVGEGVSARLLLTSALGSTYSYLHTYILSLSLTLTYIVR